MKYAVLLGFGPGDFILMSRLFLYGGSLYQLIDGALYTYSIMSRSFIFLPVAFEILGAWNQDAGFLIRDVGRHVTDPTFE